MKAQAVVAALIAGLAVSVAGPVAGQQGNGLITVAPGALAFLSSLGPALSNQTPRGTLVLRNTRWERVLFEVRVGPATDCDANPRVRLRILRMNQGWVFLSGAVVCWRREQVPGDATQGWTEWQQMRVAAGTRQEVEL